MHKTDGSPTSSSLLSGKEFSSNQPKPDSDSDLELQTNDILLAGTNLSTQEIFRISAADAEYRYPVSSTEHPSRGNVSMPPSSNIHPHSKPCHFDELNNARLVTRGGPFNLADRLPTEIICEIFGMYIELNPQPNCHDSPEDFPTYTPYSDPTKLGHICSCWRKVALNLPNLWSSIFIYNPTTHDVNRVNCFLQRSPSKPFWLQIEYNSVDMDFYKLLHIVCPDLNGLCISSGILAEDPVLCSDWGCENAIWRDRGSKTAPFKQGLHFVFQRSWMPRIYYYGRTWAVYRRDLESLACVARVTRGGVERRRDRHVRHSDSWLTVFANLWHSPSRMSYHSLPQPRSSKSSWSNTSGSRQI